MSTNNLGVYLRKQRAERRVNLVDMADAIGMSYGQLSQMETGRANISQPMLNRIADWLGLSGTPRKEFLVLGLSCAQVVRIDMSKLSDEAREIIARAVVCS